MKKTSPDLQALIAGDRNTFIYLPIPEEGDTVESKEIIQYLARLQKVGYAFDNAWKLFYLDEANFTLFQFEFNDLMGSNTKEGMIFRKSFGESFELTDYTDEDWGAILAQYSITYGWEDEFRITFQEVATDVLDKYVGSMSDEITDIFGGQQKIMSLGDATVLTKIVKNIISSPVVLRKQQIKTLEATPKSVLRVAAKNANITIKETLIKVMGLLKGEKLDFALMKTSTDVMRFIVSEYAHTPLEGQLMKEDLKAVKLKIPTSARKFLLNNLEMIGETRGAKFLTEDMFGYEMFWKRLDKYLRYEKAAKARVKYPNYTEAIDFLYDGDRSWTFNGRFSAAKADKDYASAIQISAERPGFMLRNLKEFLRMTKGTKMPVKEKTENPFHRTHNAFQKEMSKNFDIEKADNIVKTDASKFLDSGAFSTILNRNLNAKLAWQLTEELKDKNIFDSITERTVQGQSIRYSTPVPGCDRKLTKIVRDKVMNSLESKLQKINKDIGNVYIDKDSKKYRLQYSGRSSTEISFAGEFLSPGSELRISEIIMAKGIKDPLIRLGVMWRGLKEHQSVDIDHSVSVDGYHDVYYGDPTLTVNESIIATSSGDITSCGGPKSGFSVELVDLDYNLMLKNNIREFYNSLIVYSGPTKLGELESYLFFSVIDKKDRKLANRTRIDLSKADYAIRIDPDNIDKSNSYIGVSFDLEKDRIAVLCTPVQSKSGQYNNIRTVKNEFDKALSDFDKHLTINYALKKALGEKMVDKMEIANVVISRKSKDDLGLSDDVTLIHPGKQMEEINKFLF